MHGQLTTRLPQALVLAVLLTAHYEAAAVAGNLAAFDTWSRFSRDALAQAQWALVLFWLILGPGTIVVRTLAVPAGAAALWYAHQLPSSAAFSPGQLGLIEAMFLVPLLALLRYFGVTVGFGATKARTRSVRYSLAGLLFLMTLSAVAVAAAQTKPGQAAVAAVSTQLHFELIEASAALASLTLVAFIVAMRWPAAGLIAVAAIGPATGWAICYATGINEHLLFSSWTTCIAAMIWASAALLRLAGCRLSSGRSTAPVPAKLAQRWITPEVESCKNNSPCWNN